MFMTCGVRFQLVEIRSAGPNDLKDINKIERASFAYEAYSQALLAYFLRDEAFVTLVAIEGAEVIAYATIMEEDGGSGMRIVSIAVLPQRRDQGIARSIMQRIEGIAIEKGAKGLSLEVGLTNVPAINLYLRLGFSIKGKIADYYGEGKDALYMEKMLPSAQRRAGKASNAARE